MGIARHFCGAIVIGLVVLALGAPGTASATVLCRAETSGLCPAGKEYTAGSYSRVVAKAVPPVFTTSSGTISCGRAEIKVELQSEGGPGESVIGQPQSIVFAECLLGKSPCVVVTLVQPEKAKYTRTEGVNGTLSLEGAETPILAIQCSILIKCAYEFKPTTFSVTGGNPSSAPVSEQALKSVAYEGYTTCPKTTTWSKATYQSLEPQQVYFAEESSESPSPTGSSLCKVGTTPGFCPSSELYAAKQKFEGETESLTFSGSGETVTCKKFSLTLEGSTTGSSSERATGAVSVFSYGGTNSCSSAKSKKCSVEAHALPYTTQLLYATGSSGFLAVTGAKEEAEPKLFVFCGVGLLSECEYGTREPLIDLEGGASAKAVIAKEDLHLVANLSGECPAEITLGSATFSMTAPTAIYVAKETGPTSVLCKVTPTGGVCPAGETYPAEQEIKVEAEKPALVTSGEDVTCNTSNVTFKGTAKGGATTPEKGSITALSFEGCELTLGGSCTVEAVNLPYDTELQYTSGSNGTALVQGGGKGTPGATVSCAGGALACVFSAEPSLSVQGGNPAIVVATNVAMKLSEKEGFMKCPKEATWSATYKPTSPTAVYAARE
ncbi:MAG TPA: hypothetical protein VF245_07645 [Solirubrobacterales bacterium]